MNRVFLALCSAGLLLLPASCGPTVKPLLSVSVTLDKKVYTEGEPIELSVRVTSNMDTLTVPNDGHHQRQVPSCLKIIIGDGTAGDYAVEVVPAGFPSHQPKDFTELAAGESLSFKTLVKPGMWIRRVGDERQRPTGPGGYSMSVAYQHNAHASTDVANQWRGSLPPVKLSYSIK